MPCGLALGAGLSATAADTDDALVADARRDCVKTAPARPVHDQLPAGAKPCDSIDSYCGLGRPVDYAQARRCAFAADDLGVLAMLYANGRGVVPDYGLARKAVCDDRDAAPTETEARLRHLAQMEQDENAEAPGFDLCDDATSGKMTGWRASLGAKQAAPWREAQLAKLTATWPVAHQAVFATLRQSRKAWMAARDGEVDKRGTARASMIIAEEETQRDAFVALVARAEAGRVGAATPAQAKAQDARMNATWARFRRPATPATTVTMNDILAAQRAWLKYRDTWVRFAALHYPALPAPTWIGPLTEQREKELEELLEDRSRRARSSAPGRERHAVAVRADRAVDDAAGRGRLGAGRRDVLHAVVAVLARHVALVDVLHRLLGELALRLRRRAGRPHDRRAQAHGGAAAQRAAASDAARPLVIHDSPLFHMRPDGLACQIGGGVGIFPARTGRAC